MDTILTKYSVSELVRGRRFNHGFFILLPWNTPVPLTLLASSIPEPLPLLLTSWTAVVLFLVIPYSCL